MLVVARGIVRSSWRGSIDPDLDLSAVPLEVRLEVGRAMEGPRHRSYVGVSVGGQIRGDSVPRLDTDTGLSELQFLFVREGVDMLLSGKRSGRYPYLTKSLLKVDLAGD